MYVCKEVALCGNADKIWRSNWAKGRDPSVGLVGPISQPRGTIGTMSLMLAHTSALLCVFWANFNLGS